MSVTPYDQLALIDPPVPGPANCMTDLAAISDMRILLHDAGADCSTPGPIGTRTCKLTVLKKSLPALSSDSAITKES